jgi:hypothetical protein
MEETKTRIDGVVLQRGRVVARSIRGRVASKYVEIAKLMGAGDSCLCNTLAQAYGIRNSLKRMNMATWVVTEMDEFGVKKYRVNKGEGSFQGKK